MIAETMAVKTGMFVISLLLKTIIKGYKKYIDILNYQKQIDYATNELFAEFSVEGKYSIICDIEEDNFLQDIIANHVISKLQGKTTSSIDGKLKHLPKDKKIYVKEFIDRLEYKVDEIIVRNASPDIKILLQKLDSIRMLIDSEESSDKVFEYDEAINELIKNASLTIETSEFKWMEKMRKLCQLKSDISEDIISLIQEMIINAYDHGKSTETFILVSQSAIVLNYNGFQFNPLVDLDVTKGNGGFYSLKYFKQHYSNIADLIYDLNDGNNKFIISFKIHAYNIEDECKIDIVSKDYGSRDIKVILPKSNPSLYIFDKTYEYSVSQLASIFGVLSHQDNFKIPIIVYISRDYHKAFFNSHYGKSRLYFRFVKL